LTKHAYLSGQSVPGCADAEVLEKQTEIPDRKKYPNFFSWWWNLSQFSSIAKELWGEKKVCKKECKKEEEEDLDLFGEETEEDKVAADKRKAIAEYNKNNQKKLAAQESRVVMEIKGFELGQDFDALANKIYKEVEQDGLTWEGGHKILPLAFGMNYLEVSCNIVDAKVSMDDIQEKIQGLYPDEVQSVDIASFEKK
jgi:elongation factor 1-beta